MRQYGVPALRERGLLTLPEATELAAIFRLLANETRPFCLSGHVARPGLYEVAVGTSLRELPELAGAPAREPAV